MLTCVYGRDAAVRDVAKIQRSATNALFVQPQRMNTDGSEQDGDLFACLLNYRHRVTRAEALTHSSKMPSAEQRVGPRQAGCRWHPPLHLKPRREWWLILMQLGVFLFVSPYPKCKLSQCLSPFNAFHLSDPCVKSPPGSAPGPRCRCESALWVSAAYWPVVGPRQSDLWTGFSLSDTLEAEQPVRAQSGSSQGHRLLLTELSCLTHTHTHTHTRKHKHKYKQTVACNKLSSDYTLLTSSSSSIPH